jgi:hypothetical protein
MHGQDSSETRRSCQCGQREASERNVRDGKSTDNIEELAYFGYGPDLAPERPVDTYMLASLCLPSDATIQFWADPARGELGVVEMGPPEAFQPNFILYNAERAPILDIFLGLTSEKDPVPKTLLDIGSRLRENEEDHYYWGKIDDLYGTRLTSTLPEGETEQIDIEDFDLSSGVPSVQAAKKITGMCIGTVIMAQIRLKRGCAKDHIRVEQ